MEPFIPLLIGGFVIFLGFLGDLVFKKTNIPDVIWLILFGIILGPLTGLVDVNRISSIAPIFTTFALIFILFEGALDLKFKEVFSGMASGGLLAIVNFIVSVGITTGISLLFKVELIPAILLGSIVGGTSSAVVIPIVKKIEMNKKIKTSLLLESAISDVLCIVATLTIIEIIQIGTVDVANLIGGLLNSFVLATFIGMAGGYIWIRVLTKLVRYSKSYMITIAYMLLIYAFAEFINSNGAIACLALGLFLGNSTKVFKLMKDDKYTSIKKNEKFFFSEISFVVKSLFFVYLGLLLQFETALPYIIGTVIVIGLFLVRPLATITVRGNKTTKEQAIMDSLVPKGLAAAVLAQLPTQAGIPGTENFSAIAFSIILISILFSTILIFLSERGLFKGFGTAYAAIIKKK